VQPRCPGLAGRCDSADNTCLSSGTMTRKPATLIVGGSFRRSGEKVLVQKRSWEMLRIFADNLARPVFAMHENSADATLAYPLDCRIDLVTLPAGGLRQRARRLFIGSTLTQQVREAIDRCDAVYLRLPLWVCWDVFKYARSRGKKIIASFHGDWVGTYENKQAGPVKHLLFRGFSVYVDRILRRIARDSEVLFCVGRQLAEMYGPVAKRCVVFANFLHSADDIAEPRPLCTKSPYKLLYVGHLEERKGVNYLIDAVEILRSLSLDVRLTIVGAGPAGGSLKAQVEALGLADKVEFRDYVQYGPTLLEIYRQVDIFVLPSISGEGTPKVVMEAMSQAVPVVATDVGSTSNLLEGGQRGLIVPPRDAAAMAGAIRRLIEDKLLRSKLVSQALAAARESTRQKQQRIVADALTETVGELVGTPGYLRHMRQG